MVDDLKDIAETVRPFTGEDDEAPYGRKADGTARKRPAPTTTRRPPTRTKYQPERRHYDKELLALAQLPAGLLQVFAVQLQQPPLAADARTVVIYAPGICTALDQVAQEHEPTAKILDAMLKMGPFGVLFTATAPMVLQMAVNHGMLEPGTMGTVSMEQLLGMPIPTPGDDGSGNGQVGDAVGSG